MSTFQVRGSQCLESRKHSDVLALELEIALPHTQDLEASASPGCQFRAVPRAGVLFFGFSLLEWISICQFGYEVWLLNICQSVEDLCSKIPIEIRNTNTAGLGVKGASQRLRGYQFASPTLRR